MRGSWALALDPIARQAAAGSRGVPASAPRSGFGRAGLLASGRRRSGHCPLNRRAWPDQFPGCSRPRITGLANPSSALGPSPQGPDAVERRPVEAGPAPWPQAGCLLCGAPSRSFIGRSNPRPGARPSRLRRPRPRCFPLPSRFCPWGSGDARRPSRRCSKGRGACCSRPPDLMAGACGGGGSPSACCRSRFSDAGARCWDTMDPRPVARSIPVPCPRGRA